MARLKKKVLVESDDGVRVWPGDIFSARELARTLSDAELEEEYERHRKGAEPRLGQWRAFAIKLAIFYELQERRRAAQANAAERDKGA